MGLFNWFKKGTFAGQFANTGQVTGNIKVSSDGQIIFDVDKQIPHIDHKNVMTITGVWSAIRLLAGIMASLPRHIYKITPNGKFKAFDHPLYLLLNQATNEETTAYQFSETELCHLLLWGNFYSYIERNQAGEIIGLWALLPWNTKKMRDDNGDIWYTTITAGGEVRKLAKDEVLHIAGLSIDGFNGIDPVAKLRDSLGLTKAVEKYASKYFANGTKMGGILTHEGKSLDEETQKNLKKNLKETYGGVENAHKMLILPGDFKYVPMGDNAEDAQMLDSRKFQINEISRIFGVPPHLLGDLEKATFSNIEQQSLELVIYWLRPWCERIEQAITLQCLTPQERKTYFVEHDLNGILRGDVQSRFDAYTKGILNGIYTLNEVRELENLNPVENGDINLIPLNSIPADMARDYFFAKTKTITNIKTKENTNTNTNTNTNADTNADTKADNKGVENEEGNINTTKSEN